MVKHRFQHVGLLLVLWFSVWACTSDQQQQLQLQEQIQFDDQQQELSEQGLEDQQFDDQELGDEFAELEEDQEGFDDQEGIGESTENTMESIPSDNSPRQVMYVTQDNTSVYSTMDSSGSPIDNYFQGDPVVVVDRGEWGEVRANRYISMMNLSRIIVPRRKDHNPWQ